jgi:hypothetical protein
MIFLVSKIMMIIVAAYALVAADAGEISADSFENFLDEIIYL